MKKTAVLIMIILFTFISAFAGQKYKTVLVVSVDALHPDAVQRKYAPNIFKLIDKGFYSDKAKSTTPPLTLIAHTSMMTGLTPDKSGKTDNDWKQGDKPTDKETMLTYAKGQGYSTVFIYSKKKLGYLGGKSADKEIFSGQDAVDKAVEAVDGDNQFIFLHISGLDTEGPISGWLSPEYLDEFNFIDEQLGALIDKVQKKGSALIIITSDHAGHAKIHGSDDPEDMKRPLIVWSSLNKVKSVPDSALRIDGLKKYIESEM